MTFLERRITASARAGAIILLSTNIIKTSRAVDIV